MLVRSTQDTLFNVMRTNISKNQNKQIPSEQGGAVQITINEDDVNYAIKKLSLYDDCYSSGIVAVFNDYLKHKSFRQMRDELETVPETNLPPDLLWDINGNMIFLEVIYPVIKEGGASCY
jgi:hypothetical protein